MTLPGTFSAELDAEPATARSGPTTVLRDDRADGAKATTIAKSARAAPLLQSRIVDGGKTFRIRTGAGTIGSTGKVPLTLKSGRGN